MFDKNEIRRAKGLDKLIYDIFRDKSIKQILQECGFSEADFAALRENTTQFLDVVNNSLFIALDDDRCAKILISRYGLHDGNEKTLLDLVIETEMTKARIQQVQEKGYRRIRNKLEKIILRAVSGAIGKSVEQNFTAPKAIVMSEIPTEDMGDFDKFVSNEPVTRRKFAEGFVRVKRGSAERTLTKWLIANGYVANDQSKHGGICATNKGIELGLINYVNAYNGEQSRVLLNESAQKYILENWQDIVRISENDKKTAPSRTGKRWYDDEDKKLAHSYVGGMTVSELAAIHNRGKGGIRARLKFLGLVDVNGEVNERYKSQKD